jgi:hypothetical protein
MEESSSGFLYRTANFWLELGLATSLVRSCFLLWFGFDLVVDLVLIGFEWPDFIWVICGGGCQLGLGLPFGWARERGSGTVG